MAFTAAEKWSGKLWKGRLQRGVPNSAQADSWTMQAWVQSNSDSSKMTSREISAAAHHRNDRDWSLSPDKLTAHSKTKNPIERHITELSFYYSVIISSNIIKYRRNRKMWPIMKRKHDHQWRLTLRCWNQLTRILLYFFPKRLFIWGGKLRVGCLTDYTTTDLQMTRILKQLL